MWIKGSTRRIFVGSIQNSYCSQKYWEQLKKKRHICVFLLLCARLCTEIHIQLLHKAPANTTYILKIIYFTKKFTYSMRGRQFTSCCITSSKLDFLRMTLDTGAMSSAKVSHSTFCIRYEKHCGNCITGSWFSSEKPPQHVEVFKHAWIN